MCGIAGIFSTEPVAEEDVAKMLAAIAYRGPDHREVKAYRAANGACLTVGQARLAILDPRPEANQPFESVDGRTNLTFNGEFYNFLDLREELERSGANFRTRSDTEVALELFRRYGADALDRLWGMFAGAYFNLQTGELLLFRDRLGKKPLYLYRHAGRLYFASEPKAILAALDHVPQPDPEAVARFFYLGYVPADCCIYEGMWKLGAGCYLKPEPSGKPDREERWYRPENTEPEPEERLEDLFMDAVAKRMIADVPLAAFLSGGLDSSLVVAAMSRMSSQSVHTFSVRFAGPQAMDESPYARMVAEHCGTRHHEVVLDVSGLKEALPLVLDHFDEPFGDSSAVPMWLVSREARRHFTVALTGDGADEVFAGYRKYLSNHYLARLGPYALRRWLWRPPVLLLPTGRTNKFLELNRRMRRLLAADHPYAGPRHVNLLHMSPVSAETTFGKNLDGQTFAAVKSLLADRLPRDADLNSILKFDQDLVLQDDMFVKIDRMSMKASLEVRSPLVDHRIVELANGLAPQRKLNGNVRKRVLLERLGHLLPPAILDRPKTGFEMPLGAWLREDLAAWTEERLFDGPTHDWVDHAALRKIWDQHRQGRRDCTETLWHHIVFATWLQRTYA
ncbi:MAG: asparagine synthase (glutamine-hydrolyzing) [Acidobacteriota bacterium]|nr:asparagine synthase (glutamine-hydrolyzing) [Acidobacteriota bacterium]